MEYCFHILYAIEIIFDTLFALTNFLSAIVKQAHVNLAILIRWSWKIWLKRHETLQPNPTPRLIIETLLCYYRWWQYWHVDCFTGHPECGVRQGPVDVRAGHAPLVLRGRAALPAGEARPGPRRRQTLSAAMLTGQGILRNWNGSFWAMLILHIILISIASIISSGNIHCNCLCLFVFYHVQLNFVKANFIKTNNSLRRS